MAVLVTGAAGYIGSHTCLALLERGHDVVAVDNLCNSDKVSLEKVAAMTGVPLKFFESDVRDLDRLTKIIAENQIDTVFHLAGLKSVPDSVLRPLEYYDNNVGGALAILRGAAQLGVKRILFSSSASLYGNQPNQPVRETTPLLPAESPYGRTKAIVEEMLTDVAHATPGMSVVHLRYFNPAGAHPSGAIGESPREKPEGLMSSIVEVAAGRRDFLTVYGGDYPTPDGSAQRDYLHICDLAEGHVAALSALDEPGVHVFNLGAGRPVSVLELIAAFKAVTGIDLPCQIGLRRAGDLPASWADVSKAREQLGWRAIRSLEEICTDAWAFERAHRG